MFKVQIMLENDIKQLIYTEVTNSEIYYYRKRLISVAILLCFSFFALNKIYESELCLFVHSCLYK
jgi:hypothetical protein